MTFRELVFYTLLLGAGLLIGHLAHADTSHFWIQRNPHYLDRWTHNVHCCGPDHCKARVRARRDREAITDRGLGSLGRAAG